jgi:hypothetical protein
MTPEEIQKAFSNIENPEEVAEKIHELKKTGVQFLFHSKVKRLIIGQEWTFIERGETSPFEDTMKSVSDKLSINDLKSYEEADERYNLTMY